jgi:hypothetical protein
MKKSALPVSLVALLLASNAYWAYSTIDQAVTLDHVRMEMTHCGESREIIRALAPLAARLSADEFVVAAAKGKAERTVERDADAVYVDGVGFRFVGGSLSEIVISE